MKTAGHRSRESLSLMARWSRSGAGHSAGAAHVARIAAYFHKSYWIRKSAWSTIFRVLADRPRAIQALVGSRPAHEARRHLSGLAGSSELSDYHGSREMPRSMSPLERLRWKVRRSRTRFPPAGLDEVVLHVTGWRSCERAVPQPDQARGNQHGTDAPGTQFSRKKYSGRRMRS